MLGSHQLQGNEFFLEELYELRTLQILLETFGRESPPFFGRFVYAGDSAFVGVHEGDHGCEDGPDVPAGTPGFLVVVGEGGADGLAHLEPPVVSQHLDFGRGEGVVFWQLEHPMVEALLEVLLQAVEAEVVGELRLALEDH